MKKVLLLGATGHLGQVLTKVLLQHKFQVITLVRNPQKLNIRHMSLKVVKGDVTNTQDVSNVLKNIDIVISTLGHGFRTKYPIQEKTLSIIIPLMEKNNIKRFITITGSGLKIKDDPKSLYATIQERLLSLVDPYRLQDAKKQQELLENSTLDWTVVRTPIHNNGDNQKISHLGYTQPLPWKTLSRITIANFMVKCIEEDNYLRKSPIIY